MDAGIVWVADSALLAEEIGGVGAGPLCVDTEADSLHHYPEKTCLIQLSFGGRDLLVDPLGGLDLAPLGRLLCDGSLLKILHGADYDLRVLERDFGFRVRNLFDTMLAARLVGERAFGLAALLEQHLGVALDKRFQRADWSRRPLTAEMQRYAAMDTRHLEALAEVLSGRLRELGREAWAREEFRRAENVRWNPEPVADGYYRIKGSARLDRRQLGLLRELYRLRETMARERDRPPFKVVRNEVLLDLARRPTLHRRALANVRGLPRELARGAGATRLYDAIETARRLDPTELPEPRQRIRKPRSATLETDLKTLARRRDELAARLDLEPSVLAPRAVLEELVQRSREGLPVDEIDELRQWQRELVAPLLATLG